MTYKPKYSVEEVAKYIYEEGWPSFDKSMLNGCDDYALESFIKDYCMYSPLTKQYYPNQIKIVEDFYNRNYQIWMDDRAITNFISISKARKLKEQFKRIYPSQEFSIELNRVETK